MDRPSPFPPMTAADAASLGFAAFNNCSHQTIDIPDGGFTLTTRSNDGKRTTFYFGVTKKGGTPTLIDVQYHDSGATIPNADRGRSPVFDMLTIGQGGSQAYDSRKFPTDMKPSIAAILLKTIAP